MIAVTYSSFICFTQNQYLALLTGQTVNWVCYLPVHPFMILSYFLLFSGFIPLFVIFLDSFIQFFNFF